MSKAGIDLQSLYDQYKEEQHYLQQYERYKSILSADLEKFQDENACNLQEALITLYLSDFVVTSSNLRDLTLTDDERRIFILRFCRVGLEELDETMIIYLNMLAQELGKAVRRNFVYQLDRGLPNNVALTRIADTFVVPFIKFLRSVSDQIPFPWMIALTEGAILEIPAIEVFERTKEEEYLTNYRPARLADAALSILEHFGKIRTEQPNPHTIVPLLAESTGAILIRSISKNEEYFGYSELISDKKFKRLHKEFSEVCTQTKFEKQEIEPIYYRAMSASSAQDLTRQLFLVRAHPEKSDYEAWFFLSTTADDINVELTRGRLEERCQDIIGVLRRPVKPKKRPKKQKKKEKPPKIEKEEKREKIEPVEKRKPSLLKRIFGIFSRKSDKGDVSIPEKTTEEIIPEKPIEVIQKQKIEEKKKIEPDYDQWYQGEVLNIWAKSLVCDIVTGIELEELYDTIREKDYIIVGLADFPDIPKTEGTLHSVKGKAELLNKILTTIGPHFSELRDIAAQLLPEGAKETQLQFIPQEVFLEETKADLETYDLLSFASSPSSLTVLLAQNTHISTPALLAPNRVVSKRRTLQMRARQLASTKSRATFEERMGNILVALIDTTVLESHPISAQLVLDLLPENDS